MSERIVCVTPADVSRLLTSSLAREHTADPIERFARDYLQQSYLSKLTLTPEDLENRTAATFAKWRASELHCYCSNVRIGSCTDFSLLGRLLEEMRVVIRRCLGPMRPEYYRDFGAFSGGATVDTKRGTHFTMKVCRAITCGHDNIIDACHAVGHLSDGVIEPIGYCRASQVPKNDRINRMIAIEPTASMFMQKAIGSLIRRRLKRVGVDLDDQTINQQSAQRAYANSLSTIDLSAASDSISFELVKKVLPFDWFRELIKHRSPAMRFNKRDIPLQKFSSMGNGYTFELESLIFWALCKVLCKTDYINVYGDDIIVHRSDAQRVINGLTVIGFTVNPEKTFISGDFFESCGKHYFQGNDVTPCFQKEPINDIMAAFRCHNRLVRWALRGPSSRFDVIKDACEGIQNHWGHRDHAVPYGTQRDDGWLKPQPLCFTSNDEELVAAVRLFGLAQNRNGDFLCRVLVVSSKQKKLGKKLNQVALAYKYYRPHHSNEDPKGYVAWETGEVTYRSKITVVWRSSIALA